MSHLHQPSVSTISQTFAFNLTLRSMSDLVSPQDWAKPGPYDQPTANTLRRSKDRRETADPSSHRGSDVTTPGKEPHRVKGGHPLTSPKVRRCNRISWWPELPGLRGVNGSCVMQQEEREAHEELARVLARGLQLDIQGSSRDSLQGSSGYSSQTNTPCCSEDTIPSQGDTSQALSPTISW